MLDKFSRIVGDAPSGKNFVTDYCEITSLAQLRNELLSKGKSLYDRYTLGENHFANWVEHVFDDPELANNLREAKSYAEAAKLIDERISYATLWLKFHKGKETLHNYAAELSQIRVDYAPEHHTFQTLSEYEQQNSMAPPQESAAVQQDVLADDSDDHQMLKKLQESLQLNAPPARKGLFDSIMSFFGK